MNLPRLLSAAATETSGFFHTSDYTQTPHKYDGFGRQVYQARGEITVIQDSSTQNDRTKHKFKIPQNYHTMGEMVIRGYWEPLGGDDIGVNGTTRKRLINWAAREQIREIRIRSGQTSKRNVVIPGNLINTEFYICTLMREKEALAVLEVGDLTDLERDARALTRQYWEVVVPTPFNIDYAHHLPISSLQDEMEIEIVWHPDERILCYDGVTNFNIERTDVELYCEMFMHFQDQYDYQIAGLFEEDGIEYYKRDMEYIEEVIRAQDLREGNQIWVDLDRFNHECAAVFVTLRYEDEIRQENNRGHDNLLPWKEHSVWDSGLHMQGPIPYLHQVYRLNDRYTFYPIGLNALIHPNAQDITDRAHTSGSHNYSAFNKGQFRITLTDEVVAEMNQGRNIYLEFNLIVHNIITFISKTRDRTDPRAVFAEMFQIN